MIRALFAILSVFILSFKAYGQVNTYFVQFTDKDATPYSVSAPEEYLTQRSIERRNKQGISIIEEDLPVTPAYVTDIRNTGSTSVRYISRWFNGAIVQATSIDAEAIKLLSFVADVEYIAPPNVGGRTAGTRKYELNESVKSDTLSQFSILGIDEMRMAGVDGSGLLIAVIDGGFDGVSTASSFQKLFDNNQIIDEFDFISGTRDVYRYSSHGTSVLSLMAASKDDPEYEGITPAASYLLYTTENAAASVEYRVEEYWWLIAAERADSLGVDVINTSLGYYDFLDPTMNYTWDDLDGKTAVISRAAQKVAERGIVFVTSAGNTGQKAWQKISFPADVVDGIAVGSLINETRVSGFSATGPSSDGRIKPDVMAIGSGTYVISADDRIVNKSGTSFASPQVAALAAGIWQAYPELTALQVVEALRNSSTNATNPDNIQGFGIPSYRALVNFVEHLQSQEWASIYPNPTIDNLTVYINDPAEDPLVDLKLFNSNGRSVLQSELGITWHDNRYILDVSTLPRGIYVLNLRSDNKLSKLKFAKL